MILGIIPFFIFGSGLSVQRPQGRSGCIQDSFKESKILIRHENRIDVRSFSYNSHEADLEII